MSSRVFSSVRSTELFARLSETILHSSAPLERKLEKIEECYQRGYRCIKDLLRESPGQLYFRHRFFDEFDMNLLLHNTTLREIIFRHCDITEEASLVLVESIEAGNAYKLNATEMVHIKRHIGQHAYGILQRFVVGNYSLRYVSLEESDLPLHEQYRIENALQVRASWG